MKVVGDWVNDVIVLVTDILDKEGFHRIGTGVIQQQLDVAFIDEQKLDADISESLLEILEFRLADMMNAGLALDA